MIYTNSACAFKWPDDDVPIPSIARPYPTDDTLKGARLVLGNIDRRIAWLAERGLRPHPNVQERRTEVLEKIVQFEAGVDLEGESQ